MHAKSFFWYELMTTDMKAAEAFYAAVIGWTPQSFDPGGGMPYTVINAGDRGVGGIMPLPQADLPPAWVGYVYTPDIDAACESLEKAGGKVHRPPTGIPTVGRFAVVSDPQGAMFMLLAPQGPEQPPVDRTAPGQVGWHELYTSDWRAARDFYSGQFGWTAEGEFDMGAMGTYALFGFEPGTQGGGMMNKPDQMPTPAWQFYFNVEGVDAAAARVTAHGGTVLMGPMEVPGGSWVVQCQDPQGAHFALLSAAR